MKHTTLTLALACAIASTAVAQEDPKPQIKRLKLQLQAAPAVGGAGIARPAVIRAPKLDLTDEQKEKLAKLRKAQGEASRKLFQNKDLTPQDRRDQFADLRKEFQAKQDKIYTPEQLATLKKFREAQAKRLAELRKNRPVRPAVGGIGAFGLRGLELTKEQQEKLKKLNAERQEQFKKLREAPQAERREAYQKAAQDYQKKLMGILTDAQKKKLEDQRKRRPNIRILPAPGVKPLRIQPKQLKPLKRNKIS